MNVFWKQSFKIIVHTDQDTFLVHCEGIVAGQTNVSTFVSKISFLSCVGSEIKFPLSTAPASFSQTQCTVTFFFFFLSWVKSQRLSLVLHVHLLQLSLIRSFSSFFFYILAIFPKPTPPFASISSVKYWCRTNDIRLFQKLYSQASQSPFTVFLIIFPILYFHIASMLYLWWLLGSDFLASLFSPCFFYVSFVSCGIHNMNATLEQEAK